MSVVGIFQEVSMPALPLGWGGAASCLCRRGLGCRDTGRLQGGLGGSSGQVLLSCPWAAAGAHRPLLGVPGPGCPAT